ncbi:MAG: CopD family protein [Luteibaculaceae bacterium]
MGYLYVKSLHIIFIVTWFAGLFYIVRLFIYHVEALEKAEPERSILANQFKIMSKRLWYGITWPSFIITLILAVVMLYQVPGWLNAGWMHIKLAFVLVLIIYHLLNQKLYSQLQQNIARYSSNQLRVWNEVATLILVPTVFLVVLKNTTGWLYGLLGLVAFTVILMSAIKIYAKIRSKK